MKKFLSIFLCICLLLSLALGVSATEVNGNQCGDNMTWSFADGVLTITGEGEMYDYLEGGPWSAHIDEIREIVLEGNVTYIGAYAFRDYDALETVDFGPALYEIGMEAFAECDGLTKIELPETFKVFGESCFQDCPNLKQIHSQGRFPSFRQNSMWNTYATIYFPAERPWDVELIKELEEAFHGRIEFLASDGTDPYDPSMETEPAETTAAPTTEAPTTEAPTTEPPATTAPVTEPRETHAATEPEASFDVILGTAQLSQTEATEPGEEEKSGPSGMVIGGGIVGGILVLGILGKLIFGRKKGKYAR